MAKAKASYLAIHYRDFGDPLDPDGNKHQGSWKEFSTREMASNWLQVRIGKTSTSPKGYIIVAIDPALSKTLNEYMHEFHDDWPPNCLNAFNAWLNWRFKK